MENAKGRVTLGNPYEIAKNPYLPIGHPYSLIYFGDSQINMSEPSVESVFGANAGIVWRFLNSNGPNSIEGIVKATKLRRDLVFSALGWLGRENKIKMETKGRAMVFSLWEHEISNEPVADTTVKASAPRKQPMRRKSRAPKKTRKAGEIKPPARNIGSKAQQMDRTEEFLLH